MDHINSTKTRRKGKHYTYKEWVIIPGDSSPVLWCKTNPVLTNSGKILP